MPTRPLLLVLLILAVLGWAIVTRDAFEGNRRRSAEPGPQTGLVPIQHISGEPLTAGPREPVRLALDGFAPDDCMAVADASGDWARLLVQCDRRLVSLDLRSGGPQLSGEVELPPTSYVWNVVPGERSDDDVVLSLGSEGVHCARRESSVDERREVAESGALFRGEPTRASLRADFSLGHEDGTHVGSPDLAELRWLLLRPDADRAEELHRLPTSVLAQQTLGYGLADAMSCRLSVPFFQLGCGGDGPTLLFQRDDRLLRHVATTGETVDVGQAPRGTSPKILGFDHIVPPLSCDWDGDGELDVLFTVPGEGMVLGYGSTRRDTVERNSDGDRGPDQTMRVSGWILHRWLVDGDGDGRRDLVLLEVPKLNLFSQVGVLRTGRMFGSLTLRRQRDDGRFDPSPRWTESFDLPIAISLRRKQRSIHFPSPVAPLEDPRDGLLLLLPDAAGPILGRRDETGLEVRHRLLPLAEGWVVEQPFSPTFAQLDGVGGHDLAWIERPPAPEAPRVVVHRLP